VYLSYQMLSNLAPREMTADEQREIDEQLGQLAAAVARWGHRVAAQVHAVAGSPSGPRLRRHPVRARCPQPRCDLMGGSPRPGMTRRT
jgi:hypothetical protein